MHISLYQLNTLNFFQYGLIVAIQLTIYDYEDYAHFTVNRIAAIGYRLYT